MHTQQMTRAGDTGYQIGKLIADHLPKRQAEALLLTATGHTDKQAAEQMGCAPDTVKHLRKEVHFKCDTHRGPELITRAFENGYLRFASILLACLIGIGAIGTPQNAQANTTQDDQMRFRNQQRQSRTRNRRSRNARQARRTQSFHTTPSLMTWDDDTNTLLIDGIPLAQPEENAPCHANNS